MLAILLENKKLGDKYVKDYFIEKCTDNDFLKGRIESISTISSKSILFNIAHEADQMSIDKTSDNALLSAFVTVFDKMCGYYAKEPSVAKFERELDRDNLFDKFKDEFKKLYGKDWEFGRCRISQCSKEIDQAYNLITNQNHQNLIEKYEARNKLSISDFTDLVKEYIDKQEPNFRLNFFVDEVGQFISTNEKLMLYLQSIAESLAIKCKGRAWIIVTAQNDLSKALGNLNNKLSTDDYTRIMDRFGVKLDLTSADVAEVIQKRLLLKNDIAEKELSALYDRENQNFSTLFDFADCRTYKNYQSKEHFITCYPFVPYQFGLFQSTMENLSVHEAFQGKFTAIGARSMLAVFQEVAKLIGKSENVGELATFDMMFEWIRRSLKIGIQSAVLKAEQNLRDEFAIRVLKALFLVKYIKDFKSTIRNISVLMYGNFNENVSDLSKRIEEALNLLEQEMYIQRTADVYEFLTNEEKDIEEEIKNTDVERDLISNEVAKLIFDGIIKNSKIRYGEDGRDYPFSRKMDEKLYSREQELAIHIISPLNDNATNLNNCSEGARFSMQYVRDLVVVLEPDFRLVSDVILYKQTEKYLNESRSMQQQETVKRILTDRSTQNNERYVRIRQTLEELVGKAKFYIGGNEIEIGGEQAQSRIIKAFQELVSRTYNRLNMVCGHTYKEDEVNSILSSKQQSLFSGEGVPLSEAEQEILGAIQRNTSYRNTVKDILDKFDKIPYGWSYPAILCNIAKLCARRKLEVKEDSNILADDEIATALRSTQRQPNLILQPQMEFSPASIRNLKDFYGDFANEPSSENDAKTLALNTAELIKNKLKDVEILLAKEPEYKFLNSLKPIKEKLEECTGKAYSWYLTDFRNKSDELLDLKENVIDPVSKFVNGVGGEIYRNAVRFMQEQKDNFTYLDFAVVREVSDILEDANCYKGNSIQILKEKVEHLKSVIDGKLNTEKENASKQLDEVKFKITSMSEYSALAGDKKELIERAFNACKERIANQKLIVVVKTAIDNFKDSEYRI